MDFNLSETYEVVCEIQRVIIAEHLMKEMG